MASKKEKVKKPKKVKERKQKEVKLNKKGKPKKTKKQILLIIFNIFLIICILGVIAALIFGFWFANYIVKNAPPLDSKNLLYSESSLMRDANGNVYYEFSDEKRVLVEYKDLPEVLIDAIVATEDSEFFQHEGLNVARFIKASIGQALGKGDAGGASTISMQVIKNNFTSNTASGWQGIVRKFTDIYLAMFKLEKTYTKQQILEFYVNKPFLGSQSYGIEQASKTYFGKSVSDISLPEAALLTGLFKAPGSYDPYTNPENAAKRRDTVLYLMVRHGYITQEEADAAAKVSIESMLIGKNNTENKYNGFIDTVLSEITKKTGLDPKTTAMDIYTTMIPSKQDHINCITSGECFDFPDDVAQTGIAVVDVNTGAIVAIGRGRNKGLGDGNLAINLNHQIGSTAKPIFDYGPAIEYNKFSTYNPVLDEPYSYSNGKKINNHDSSYKGLMTLKEALGTSRNIPALKVFQQVDNKNIYNFATGLGITPETSEGSTSVHEAHSIGAFTGSDPLEMAAAYAAFANGGYYIEPYSVTKIILRDTGEVIEFTPKKTKAMEESTAALITNILKWCTESGMANRASRISGIEIAAKTGTTNFDENFIRSQGISWSAINDLWVVGYSPDYSIGMWYGYEKFDKNHYNTSTNWVTRDYLFKAIAKGIFEYNGHKFKTSNSIRAVEIEKGTVPAMLPSEYTPSDMRITEYFIKGTEPTEVSPRFSKLNSVTNLDAKIVNTTVKLTWKHTLPEHLTDAYLKNYYNNSTFKGFEEKYYNQRKEEDKAKLGDVIFNVYLKQANGSLKLLKQTTEKEYTYNITKADTDLEFVVKTSYTVLKNNESDPASVKLSVKNVLPVLTVSLSTSAKLNINVGSTYQLPTKPPVIVLDSLIDVTSSSNITTTIKKDNINYTGTKLDTSKPCTYTITYTATYKGVSESITQTINVVNQTTSSSSSTSSSSQTSNSVSSSNSSSSNTNSSQLQSSSKTR